ARSASPDRSASRRAALGDTDLVEEHVIVAPRLEVAQLVADRVDRDAVVRPDLRLVLPEDLLDLLVLLLAHLRIGHAALGDELLDARIGKARELLRPRPGEPLPEVPVGLVRHVRPARQEEVALARAALPAPRGGLELAD